jgi:hypothetical protein
MAIPARFLHRGDLRTRSRQQRLLSGQLEGTFKDFARELVVGAAREWEAKNS